MTNRRFDIGRQNDALLNEEHYNIFKILEPYIKNGTANSTAPISGEGVDEIADGAMWIDRHLDTSNSDLKYFSNGQWNIFFKNRFKITESLLSEDEPNDPIESQLWIDQEGVLRYYHKGVFKPIKAIPDNEYKDPNLSGFEDFIITSSLTATEQTLVDNFTSWLLDSVPLQKWAEGKQYTLNTGCVHDLDIYICKKEHTSDSSNEPVENSLYWTKLQKLYQYLVPNANEDKFFIDGYYSHQQCTKDQVEKVATTIAGKAITGEVTPQGLKAVNNGHVHDTTCNGYKIDTNVSISFPIEMIDGKTANSVHVSPKRLYNVEKKFIMIDKNNPIIEVQEENTEFYAFYGGIGKLLVKTDNKNTTEYESVVSNNIDCIKLSAQVAATYDFVYAVHYDFLSTNIKQLGTVDRKRQKLNEDNYIWIGPCNKENICVFAQGLFYANDDDKTWSYNPETEYLYLAEKLQDYDNMVKTFDFSVIEFPEKYEGKVSNNFVMYDGQEMFRINLPAGFPKSREFICFASGLNLDVVAGEVIQDPNNPRILYIPSITKSMYDNKEGDIFYCVVGTQKYTNGNLEVDMYRGKTQAKYNKTYGVHIPIYSDRRYPIADGLYLAADEAPLLFVDGVLVFQSEIERGDNYLSIYGLKEGQEVILLGDYKDPTLTDIELSDHLIFEDTVSYATIPTQYSDATIVYVANGILADASAVYTSKKPEDEGYHGEIRYHASTDADTWYRFNTITGNWEDISHELYTDPITGEQQLLIDILDKSSRGYTHTKKSISFLQNIGNEVCTYYAYAFSNSIEKPLLMGYCYPNGKDGVNVNSSTIQSDPQPFKINSRHVYVPGRNELSVYLNGVYQSLNSPNDIGFINSKNREGKNGKYDELVLAIDNNTDKGLAIPSEEGYYVYSLKSQNEDKTLVKEAAITNAEKVDYESKGFEIDLISEPNRNSIFYVIEPTESGEARACTRTKLTFKDSLASSGAYTNNAYNTGSFLLTRGNLRVYINGLRQPYGSYQTLASRETENPYLQAFKVLDSRTIEIQDPIIGGMGGNEGTDKNPLFEIGNVINSDGSKSKAYYQVIDEIIIECRPDLKLRECTVPIRDNSGEFTVQDGLPEELFKTKDRVMIYINGLAYGKEYKIEENSIKLLNSEIKQLLGNSKTDVITFEWR